MYLYFSEENLLLCTHEVKHMELHKNTHSWNENTNQQGFT